MLSGWCVPWVEFQENKWCASKQLIKEKPNSKRTSDMQVCNWYKKNLAGTSPFNNLVIDCMNKPAHQLCLLWQAPSVAWNSQKMNSQFIVTLAEHSSKCGTKWKLVCSVVSPFTVNICGTFFKMWDQMKTALFHSTSP
jgi:hypothetical protein